MPVDMRRQRTVTPQGQEPPVPKEVPSLLLPGFLGHNTRSLGGVWGVVRKWNFGFREVNALQGCRIDCLAGNSHGEGWGEPLLSGLSLLQQTRRGGGGVGADDGPSLTMLGTKHRKGREDQEYLGR